MIDEVLASPDRYEMKQYGGDTDSMTYRNKINKLKKKMAELATPHD